MCSLSNLFRLFLEIIYQLELIFILNVLWLSIYSLIFFVQNKRLLKQIVFKIVFNGLIHLSNITKVNQCFAFFVYITMENLSN